MLWEVKQSSGTDEALYGCLNPKCADSLQSGLVAWQLIMIFVLLGLAFLNMFSIGLASSTLKIEIHSLSRARSVGTFISLILIIIAGVSMTLAANNKVLKVNPDTEFDRDQIALPKVA